MQSADPLTASASSGPATQPEPTNQPSSQQLALLAGLFIVAIWGANFTVQKSVMAIMSPAAFLFARYLVIPTCAALLLLSTNRWRWLQLPREDALKLAGLGILGHTVHVGSVTYGIHWSTAFSSALIMACGPVFTLLLLHWAGLERLTRAQVVGVGLAFIGVLVFLSDKMLGQQWGATGGDLMMLASASLFSYYTVMTKPLIQRHGSVPVMAYATLAGSPLLVLLGLPAALETPWSTLTALNWGQVLWASLISNFMGWLVWSWVNVRRGVARTAPLLYLMPLVAGVVAWWATGERFTVVKVIGAVVALGGVALAQFATRNVDDPVREAPALID